MLEIVCTIEQPEKSEIERLYERRISLQNLLKRLQANAPSKQIAAIDAQEVIQACRTTGGSINTWWSNTLKKYNLPDTTGHVYHVDLSSGEIAMTARGMKTVTE